MLKNIAISFLLVLVGCSEEIEITGGAWKKKHHARPETEVIRGRKIFLLNKFTDFPDFPKWKELSTESLKSGFEEIKKDNEENHPELIAHNNIKLKEIVQFVKTEIPRMEQDYNTDGKVLARDILLVTYVNNRSGADKDISSTRAFLKKNILVTTETDVDGKYRIVIGKGEYLLVSIQPSGVLVKGLLEDVWMFDVNKSSTINLTSDNGNTYVADFDF